MVRMMITMMMLLVEAIVIVMDGFERLWAVG